MRALSASAGVGGRSPSGSSPARAGRAERALIVLVTATLVVLTGIGFAPAAQADEAGVLASIRLTKIKPSLPKRDGTITLAGEVTNTSQERIIRPQVILWRNQAPITDTEGLDQALHSHADDPLGQRYTPSYQDLYDPAKPYLEPGKKARFSLTAQVSALGLAPTDGVYLMGVHLLQNGVPRARARARVFVPVLRTPPKNGATITSLVLLTSRPSQLAPGLLADDHLAGEVAPAGRLSVLLRAALDEQTSFAVDPSTVEELQTMRAGYRVRSGEGATQPGPGQVDAARWLAELTQLKTGHDGYRLLFGSPDVAALVHADQRAALTAALEAGRQNPLTADLPLLVLPTAGAADEETVRAVQVLDPRALLVADTATSGAGPLLRGPAGVPVLAYGATALGGGPGPAPSGDAVHIQQRTLATSWIEAAHAGPPRARLRLVQTAAQADSADYRSDPPWVRAVPLSTLLARTPATWNERFHYPKKAAKAELSRNQLASLDRFADSQATWQDLLVDHAAAGRAGEAALARAASGAWRRHNRARKAFLAPQQERLDERLLNQIRISSTRKVSTVARQGVEFPITVRNDLPATARPGDAVDPNTVRVRLRFASDNQSRLRIDPITTPPIAPQDGYTGNAEVTARANGIVPVTAQLYTLGGHKVGRPVQIEVRVTQNGTTGWAIALVAGVVLIASTSFRIRQVTRERARANAAQAVTATDEPVSALSSAPPAEIDPSRRDDPPTVGG